MDRIKDKLPLAVAALLTGVVSLAHAETNPVVLPLGQPEYEFLYDRLERSEALTTDNLEFQIGPYSTTPAESGFGPYSKWQSLSPNQVGLFAFGAEDFRSRKRTNSISYESMRGGLVGRPFSKLAVYADFLLDEELADDPSYTGKKWRGLAGDVDQAFVRYESDVFALTAGRFVSFWGPRRSLIVGSHQKLDGLQYTLKWGRASISYRLNQLDGLDPESDSTATFEPRYFAAHRFDLHLAENFRLGLFETVVFGGPGREIDFFYLNPLIFFHGSQLNEDYNDNTTVGLDFDYFPRDGLKLYGQWLVDDIQLDNKTRGDNEPNEFGVLLGGYWADAVTNFDLRVEYTAVTNWTFNQMFERNRYLNDGEPLGAIRGNDYDEIALAAIYWWRSDVATRLNLGYVRQGEGRINAPFTNPWSEVDNYAEPFPTGIVQKTLAASLRVQAFVYRKAYVDAEAGADFIDNLDHIDGHSETRPFFKVRLSVFALSRLNLE